MGYVGTEEILDFTTTQLLLLSTVLSFSESKLGLKILLLELILWQRLYLMPPLQHQFNRTRAGSAVLGNQRYVLNRELVLATS